MIDKKKLLDHLEQIRSSLQELSDRDFGGNFTSEHVGRLRMVKYIIGAIERGIFNEKEI